MIDDAEVKALLLDRRRLQRDLAHVMARVGASTPNRQKINKQRAKHRHKLRKALRLNSEQIATRCLILSEDADGQG